MIRVRYYGDPCRPHGYNHRGLPSSLIEEDFRDFVDEISAYEFLMTCEEPITQVKDIFPKGRVPKGILNKDYQYTDMDNIEVENESQELPPVDLE